jgi:DNA-binding PadR family transcriptional regulator
MATRSRRPCTATRRGPSPGGSLYPSLHKLEQGGLIVGRWEEKETGRKRRYYHITKQGRAALAEKLESWAELTGAVNRILEDPDPHGQA